MYVYRYVIAVVVQKGARWEKFWFQSTHILYEIILRYLKEWLDDLGISVLCVSLESVWRGASE